MTLRSSLREIRELLSAFVVFVLPFAILYHIIRHPKPEPEPVTIKVYEVTGEEDAD